MSYCTKCKEARLNLHNHNSASLKVCSCSLSIHLIKLHNNINEKCIFKHIHSNVLRCKQLLEHFSVECMISHVLHSH